MPRRDGTGPAGMGSRTGRGLGMCTDEDAPRFGRKFGGGYGRGSGVRARNGFGYGLGYGFRGGRGNWSDRPWGSTPREATDGHDAKKTLEERAAFLKAELASMKQRMKEME